MRRRLLTAMMLCGLLLLARPAHAQVDNQCQGGDCSGGGGSAYDDLGDHAGCMTGGNVCGSGWESPYTGNTPTDSNGAQSGTPSGCVANHSCARWCDALESAVNEMGGQMFKFWTGQLNDDGEPIYEVWSYYSWWGNWAYYNGAGNCVGGRAGD